jgi:hypothetical protein
MLLTVLAIPMVIPSIAMAAETACFEAETIAQFSLFTQMRGREQPVEKLLYAPLRALFEG